MMRTIGFVFFFLLCTYAQADESHGKNHGAAHGTSGSRSTVVESARPTENFEVEGDAVTNDAMEQLAEKLGHYHELGHCPDSGCTYQKKTGEVPSTDSEVTSL